MNTLAASFPFRSLRHDTYATVDVLLFIDYKESLQFLFTVNRQARLFLHSNMVAIMNAFKNDGLIIHEIDNTLDGFRKLE